jgi:carbon monoxide dehydrogenase subunit G
MPRFSGTLARTFTVERPLADVMAVMTDPARFSVCLTDLESITPVGDAWRLVLKEKSEKGVHFKGDYTVRYTTQGDALTWSTTSHGNMSTQGRAAFRALGAARTEVTYTETIDCDMDVNRLLAVAIKPIVDREISKGVGGYLDRVKAHLES